MRSIAASRCSESYRWASGIDANRPGIRISAIAMFDTQLKFRAVEPACARHRSSSSVISRTDIMSAIVDCPVCTHQFQNVRGIRLCCRQRRHTRGDAMGHLARRDGVSSSPHPRDVCAANHRDEMIVLRGGDIQHRAPPPFPPPVPCVVGLMNAHTVISRHRLQWRPAH